MPGYEFKCQKCRKKATIVLSISDYEKKNYKCHVLLGLLLGAVVGLWPFQEGVVPNPGDVWSWPVQVFTPGLGQVFGALGLAASGLAVTLGIDRLGGGRTEGKGSAAAG